MIMECIQELVLYGMDKGLIDKNDEVYVTNRLLELFGLIEYDKREEVSEYREINEILEDMLQYAYENKLLKNMTVTEKDLFDTKIMGCITPAPSIVREKFKKEYEKSPKDATDFYYSFSVATNYIRKNRIEKDEKWIFDSNYGPIDITINLSKPEKDPKEIAKAGKAQKSGYPSCLLCMENEGYAGHIAHPARQNHRIIPIQLDSEDYFLQYSPYVYYNEHCIIFNKKHIHMKIDKDVFHKLLSFVSLFPHYTAGSNADLPIVGGSILSHDHFQGGGYIFAMAKADYDETFVIPGYEDVTAGIVKWPMSVIRLRSKSMENVVTLADHILMNWRSYTDEKAFIFSETNGEPHNTITPIARMRGDLYELDLVLRNNITTKECPWGVYHPSADLHHIKKENIGLIEVMGLAVLPARLKKEMEVLEEAILKHEDIRNNELIEKHADWVEQWINEYDVTADNIHKIIQDEIGKVFVKVLECAGVFKCTQEGKEAFHRFIDSLF